jgi:hypothetical protein
MASRLKGVAKTQWGCSLEWSARLKESDEQERICEGLSEKNGQVKKLSFPQACGSRPKTVSPEQS